MKYPPNTEPVSAVVMKETVTAPLGSTEMQRSEGGDSWAILENGMENKKKAPNAHLMRVLIENRTSSCIIVNVWLKQMERNRVEFIVEHKFTSIHVQLVKKKGVL